jgi:membrane protein implicated in regulation of membrane protease activity
MALWFITSATLFILELATRRGYAFWAALMALLITFLSETYPQYVTYPWQMGGFFAGVLISSILWSFYQKNRPHTISRNSLELINTQLTLNKDTKKGHGKIQIDGVTWYLATQKELTAGTNVIVYGVDGVVLKIKPIAT